MELEADSAGEEGSFFEFDCEDLHHLLINNPIELAGNFPNEVGELGSPCRSTVPIVNDQENFKHNLNAASGSGEFLHTAEINASNLTASLVGTPQNSNWNGMGVVHGFTSPLINQQEEESLRSEQLPNQLQLHNQVPVCDPQYHQYSMLPAPAPSMLPGPQQQFPYQINQVPGMAPNMYDPQGFETMLPDPSLSFRLPEFAEHHHQVLPSIFNISQNYNSMPWSFQPLDAQHQQLNPVQLSLNMLEQRHHNSRLPAPLTFSGTQNANTSLQSQLLYSETHFQQKKGILGRRNRGNRISEVGESSSSFKRSRAESTIPQEMHRLAWKMDQIPESGDDKLWKFNLRPIKNAIYDPLFEGIGLPIDPHLRMLSLL